MYHVHVHIHLHVCASFCLSVCLSACLSVHLCWHKREVCPPDCLDGVAGAHKDAVVLCEAGGGRVADGELGEAVLAVLTVQDNGGHLAKVRRESTCMYTLVVFSSVTENVYIDIYIHIYTCTYTSGFHLEINSRDGKILVLRNKGWQGITAIKEWLSNFF